jgi:EF hand
MKITLYLIAVIIFAVTVSCSLSIANEEKEHICFRIIDSDKDGIVTFQEFEKYFGNDLEKFNAIDLDKNGTLSHDEYHKSIGHGS